MNEIWVPSEASRESFVDSGVKESIVTVMPGGVDPTFYTPDNDKLDLTGLRGFNFLVNIEWIPRKCGLETIKAFLETFDGDDDVAIILKAYNAVSDFDPGGGRIGKEILKLKQQLGKPSYAPILLLPTILPTTDMAKLYATADCVILASRGEGWGLPITEAMATGKPYIATNYSGMKDIISDETGYLLDITGMSVIPPYGVPNDRVITGFKWADPDFDHLKSLMKYVFTHQDEASAKGKKGREYVESSLTWSKSVERMYSRLIDITRANKNKLFISHKMPNGAEKQAAFVVPSMGKQCGIADYTQTLSYYIVNKDPILQSNLRNATPNPLDRDVPDLVWDTINATNIVHYQIEYGLYAPDDFLKANKMLNNRALIATLHSIDEQQLSYNSILWNVFDKLIVHSEEMKQAAINSGCKADKVVVIPHGCWDYGLTPKPQKDAVETVGSFGFMFPQKGWIETAIALDQLPQYKWRLFSSKVEGHDNSEKYHRRFSTFVQTLENLNMEWIEDFVPENEMIANLNEVDVILIPYTIFLNQHAISGAVRRCLASGVPIICTDTPYFSDLNEEVCKMSDNEPETIKSTLLYIDKNKQYREDLIQKADKFIKTNSWENIADKHIQLWKELW
jgi:glycosyltransferase involved in cell wall biosynthesis